MKACLKAGAFILLAAALALVSSRYNWGGSLGEESLLAALRHVDKPAAALLYTAGTVVACSVLAVPGVTFAVIAGVLFGPWLGTLLCLAATTLGAVVSFLAGRFFLKDLVKPMLAKSPMLQRVLFDETGRSAMILLMITRLAPIFPFNLQNFAYGVTDIPLSSYTLYTFIFMAPGAAAFTMGAAGLLSAENRARLLIPAALLLAATAYIGSRVGKKYSVQPDEEVNKK